MNLAERLNEKSNDIEINDDKIADEIVNYFKDIFESGEFEKVLEERIGKDVARERKYPITVEFWAWSAGCSDTHFRIGPFCWNNPENPSGYASHCYKGVELRTIDKKVGARLLNLAKYRLQDMGFSVTIKDKECWMNYFDKELTISW